MSEETRDKQEEKKDVKKPEPQAEQTEQKKDAKPAAEGDKTTQAKAAEKAPPKVEKVRPTNCAACNKQFKYKHWFYKNGKYFCTKRCWKKFLAENYHFDISQKPVCIEGCLEPVMHGELMSHAFSPAEGNALLVGDAAGFILPVILDGIIPGLKSGLLAANSIKRAIETGEQADRIYLAEVEDIISKFKAISPWVEKIAGETESGGGSLPEVLCGATRYVLKTFES